MRLSKTPELKVISGTSPILCPILAFYEFLKVLDRLHMLGAFGMGGLGDAGPHDFEAAQHSHHPRG